MRFTIAGANFPEGGFPFCMDLLKYLWNRVGHFWIICSIFSFVFDYYFSTNTVLNALA